MLRRPSIGAGEIAWRWSFGAAVAALLGLSLLEYLDTLPVTRAELLLLKTRQTALVARALQQVLAGSGFRLVESLIVLGVTLAVGWIVLAALGRAATLKALLAYFPAKDRLPSIGDRIHLRSLFGLNLFRVGVTVAAFIGSFAALLAEGFVSQGASPSPGIAFLLFVVLTTLVWLAWAVLNGFLTLASLFVVADGQDTFGAAAAAVDFCCERAGPIFAVGTWFGLSHLAAFFLASIVAGVVLGFAGILPPGLSLLGILFVTLLYLAVADYLSIGRLAAYVAILRWPAAPAPAQDTERIGGGPSFTIGAPVSAAVDATELILSDLPNPAQTGPY